MKPCLQTVKISLLAVGILLGHGVRDHADAHGETAMHAATAGTGAAIAPSQGAPLTR